MTKNVLLFAVPLVLIGALVFVWRALADPGPPEVDPPAGSHGERTRSARDVGRAARAGRAERAGGARARRALRRDGGRRTRDVRPAGRGLDHRPRAAAELDAPRARARGLRALGHRRRRRGQRAGRSRALWMAVARRTGRRRRAGAVGPLVARAGRCRRQLPRSVRRRRAGGRAPAEGRLPVPRGAVADQARRRSTGPRAHGRRPADPDVRPARRRGARRGRRVARDTPSASAASPGAGRCSTGAPCRWTSFAFARSSPRVRRCTTPPRPRRSSRRSGSACRSTRDATSRSTSN